MAQAIPNKGKEGEAILNNHLSVTYGTLKYLEGVFSNNCKLLAIPLNKAYLSNQFEYAYKTSWLLIFRFSSLRYKHLVLMYRFAFHFKMNNKYLFCLFLYRLSVVTNSYLKLSSHCKASGEIFNFHCKSK